MDWELDNPKAGNYKVLLACACDPGSAGSVVEAKVGETVPSHRVESSGAWHAPVIFEAGGVEISQAAGVLQVSLTTVEPSATFFSIL